MIIDTEFNSAAQVPTRICVDAAQLAEELNSVSMIMTAHTAFRVEE